MRVFIRSIILWGIVLSAGCQATSVESEVPFEPTPSGVVGTVSTSVPELPTQGAATQMNPTSTGLQRLIDQAMQDLAQQLSISTGQINLVEATAVTWPDSSLGCPQKDMQYTQVLTPGYLILLEYGGHIFEYHTGSVSTIVTCDNPSPPVPGEPGNT